MARRYEIFICPRHGEQGRNEITRTSTGEPYCHKGISSIAICWETVEPVTVTDDRDVEPLVETLRKIAEGKVPGNASDGLAEFQPPASTSKFAQKALAQFEGK